MDELELAIRENKKALDHFPSSPIILLRGERLLLNLLVRRECNSTNGGTKGVLSFLLFASAPSSPLKNFRLKVLEPFFLVCLPALLSLPPLVKRLSWNLYDCPSIAPGLCGLSVVFRCSCWSGSSSTLSLGDKEIFIPGWRGIRLVPLRQLNSLLWVKLWDR